MKAVMLSVQPLWCHKILTGEKTVELRKTRPNISPPFKCYLYCTKHDRRFVHRGVAWSADDLYRLPSGEIEYGYSGELADSDEPRDKNCSLNGTVVGEFICDGFDVFDPGAPRLSLYQHPVILNGCLELRQVREYLRNSIGYGWHISNLVIYDKPKPLRAFKKHNWEQLMETSEGCPKDCMGSQATGSCAVVRGCDADVCPKARIAKAPLSWCYVAGEP